MFLIRARRGLGLTAHRGWARLLIDRMDTQVQRPEFPQAPEPAWGSTKALHRTTRPWTPTTTTTPPPASTLVLRAKGACFFAGLNPTPPARGEEKQQ